MLLGEHWLICSERCTTARAFCPPWQADFFFRKIRAILGPLTRCRCKSRVAGCQYSLKQQVGAGVLFCRRRRWASFGGVAGAARYLSTPPDDLVHVGAARRRACAPGRCVPLLSVPRFDGALPLSRGVKCGGSALAASNLAAGVAAATEGPLPPPPPPLPPPCMRPLPTARSC